VIRNVLERRDRRKSRRIKDPIVIFLYRDRSKTKEARPLDLCLEGIGIETTTPLRVNEHLQIAIIIGECQVNALGTVVYSKREEAGHFRSGIKFREISERNRGIIELYLEKTHQLARSDRYEKKPSDRTKKAQAP
jgi:hypothetical protein